VRPGTLKESSGAVRRRDHAYDRLVEPHRDELRAHCYRLLRSHHDAEDALQEALVRAWRGLPGFEGRGSLRSWLFRIATNASIDAMNGREPAVPSEVAEPTETAPDAAEDEDAKLELEVTLRAALELLPPRQLNVLALRVLLGFSAQETADLLGTTVVAVNSALQRARATLRAAREMAELGEALALRAR
jgi:RNA polymerase sigma factor (sigma-70 family)